MRCVHSCLVLAIAVLSKDVLSVSTEKNEKHDSTTLENESQILKRQTDFQNGDFNPQQQIPQEFFDFIQQTDVPDNVGPQQFRQQNGQQVLLPGFPSNVLPPTTTTTLSPFTVEQLRFQQEYARRPIVNQQNVLLRASQMPPAQPLPAQSQFQPTLPPQSQFQPTLQSQARFQSQPVARQRFVDQNAQVPNFEPQPDDVSSVPVRGQEPFSYSAVQFGPTEPSETVTRPKGQRSVSRPRVAADLAAEPIAQQTVDYTAAAYPVPVKARLSPNAVYVQPNGQMYKPIEDTEPVVSIPRKNYYYQPQPESTTVMAVSASTSTTTAAAPVEGDEEQLVFIPRPRFEPKKPDTPQRPRQEPRKPVRVQRLRPATRTETLPPPTPTPPAESAEVTPDDFLTSLLARFQQQQQQPEQEYQPQRQQQQPEDRTKAPRAGPRPKAGNGNRNSKYIADKNQLQLLQFPHELESLSGDELRALEQVNAARISAHQKSAKAAAAVRGNRPVPTPVELDDEQREFLATQGIRHLYRVDYDRSGNPLPLTYVLALDNRPQRIEQQPRPEEQ